MVTALYYLESSKIKQSHGDDFGGFEMVRVNDRKVTSTDMVTFVPKTALIQAFTRTYLKKVWSPICLGPQVLVISLSTDLVLIKQLGDLLKVVCAHS